MRSASGSRVTSMTRVCVGVALMCLDFIRRKLAASARALRSFCGALLIMLAFTNTDCASAQSTDDLQLPSLFSEFRLGYLEHDVRRQVHANEKGQDVNLELLFSRPAIAYTN